MEALFTEIARNNWEGQEDCLIVNDCQEVLREGIEEEGSLTVLDCQGELSEGLEGIFSLWFIARKNGEDLEDFFHRNWLPRRTERGTLRTGRRGWPDDRDISPTRANMDDNGGCQAAGGRNCTGVKSSGFISDRRCYCMLLLICLFCHGLYKDTRIWGQFCQMGTALYYTPELHSEFCWLLLDKVNEQLM